MNLRRRPDDARARSTTPRRILITLLVAFAAMALAAPDAKSASTSTGSNPAAPLWREYPLEQTVTTTARSTVASTDSTGRVSEQSAPDAGRQTPWIAFLLTGIAMALIVATAVVLRRKSAADRSRAGLFSERAPRAAAMAASTAALPTEGRASRTPPGARRRGAVVPERRAKEAERPPAGAERPPGAAAGTGRALAHSAEAPESRTAGTEQPPAAPAAPPVAPRAKEHSAAAANVIPEAPDAPPSAPQHSAPQADAEPAPTATPARSASRAPQTEGARASAAPRAPSRQRSGVASRPGPPPPRAATSDKAARAASGRAARPRRENAAAAQAAQTPRADRAAVERDTSRTRATVRGPICQIRWLPAGRGSCFAAVTSDAHGVERTIATSPRVEWRRATPPEQSPEAQTALRHLAKTLRDNGWRPMRAKGKDFSELRWYARRFRGPESPAEDDGPVRSASGGSAP